MSTENDVQTALCSILERGILVIRGNSSNIKIVNIESDHIHHLPRLLLAFDMRLLQHYWEIERSDYLSRAPEKFARTHREDWSIIESFLTLENS